MKVILASLFCLFIFASVVKSQELDILGQSGGIDPSMFLDSDIDSASRLSNEEKKVEKFQTFFIQEVFTRPMFEMQGTMIGDEDDEDEEGFVSSKQDNEMMNMILSNVLARDLAKRDAFRLKKILLSRASEF
jgi:hypothetical protein